MSAAFASPFNQNYLFIRTYMSALVDMMQDYKKMSTKQYRIQEPGYEPGCHKLPVITGNVIRTDPASNYRTMEHQDERP
jgi:hypothetical protein